MKISTNFAGGNALIKEITDTHVTLEPDVRDTEGGWFYFAFAVTEAAGQTVSFTCKNWIGKFGAAVSFDLLHWDWVGNVSDDGSTFTYTFPADQPIVYFAHHMLYLPSRFHAFCERNNVPVRTLCTDRNGTPVPYVRIGSGEKVLLLTSRHHCCESTGTYIMEGMLAEFLRSPREDFSIIAVPFMDADGVIAGDQGKNRRPHDHNRDYGKHSLYPSVRVVKAITSDENVKAAFDLHSPWHQGGRDDTMFIVRNIKAPYEEFLRMGRLFEAENTADAFTYHTENDIDPGVTWNEIRDTVSICWEYCGEQPDTDIAFTLETAYFGTKDNPVSQNRLIAAGGNFLRAVWKFFDNKDTE